MSLLRLDLDAPKPDPAPAPQTRPHSDKVAFVTQRTQAALASGEAPEWLFLLQDGPGLVSFRHEQKNILLLFTSPSAAMDYMRAVPAGSSLGQFAFKNLPALARDWDSFGVTHFALNKCPRCPEGLVGAAKVLLSEEHFRAIWASDRASRELHGRILIDAFQQHIERKERQEAKAALEHIRDHINCGIPHLHQMIGLTAIMLNDDATKANAEQRLKEFGPAFSAPLEFTPEVLATATLGLLMNFGMGPNAAAAG